MFTKRTKIQAMIAAALLAMSLAACDVDGEYNESDRMDAEQPMMDSEQPMMDAEQPATG